MEVKQTRHRKNTLRHTCWCVVVLLLALPFSSMGQEPPVKRYTVKDGKMFIALSKNIQSPSLDSFITQYGLEDLDLKQFLHTNIDDSLKKLGWRVDINNFDICVISKPFMSLGDMISADKITFTGKAAALFSGTGTAASYGYNRFKNKYPFAAEDSLVTFFLRSHKDAGQVVLSGSFVDWSPEQLRMRPVDSGWIIRIKLGPGKYWYKFIIDGNWDIDHDNQLSENDGEGNINSVFYKTNTVFRLNGAATAKKVYVAGSFNNWQPKQLAMNRTGTGWELPVYLAPGTHTYRFIVDGNWQYDTGNPEKLPNEFNDYNSVIRIGKPYLFKLDGYTNAKKVILTGSFNGWKKYELMMSRTETGWELPYNLGAGNYEYRFVVDGKEIKDPANNYEGSENSCLVLQPNHTFRLKNYPGAKNVFLAGDFNGWSPKTFAMKKQGSDWVIDVYLSPGKHLYKMVVDGNWIIDPGNKLWEQNEFGTGNSVLWIGK